MYTIKSFSNKRVMDGYKVEDDHFDDFSKK